MGHVKYSRSGVYGGVCDECKPQNNTSSIVCKQQSYIDTSTRPAKIRTGQRNGIAARSHGTPQQIPYRSIYGSCYRK